MDQRIIDGVELTNLGPCTKCGCTPTDADLDEVLLNYREPREICGICGKPIRLTHIDVRHVHVPGPQGPFWDISGLAYEKQFQWTTHQQNIALSIHAHLPCSIGAMPFASWDGKEVQARSSEAPCVENLEVESPCPRCGAVIEESDKAAAVDWLFRVFSGPCVYCGGLVRILRAKIEHRSWLYEGPCRRWGTHEVQAAPTISWCGHVLLPGGGLESLYFNGHPDCARLALPHAHWTPPLDRPRWRKQDWSLRIEPWQKGYIKGEAVPDWGLSHERRMQQSPTAGKVT